MKLNGRFPGKTSLAKNFQMNFRGGDQKRRTDFENSVIRPVLHR